MTKTLADVYREKTEKDEADRQELQAILNQYRQNSNGYTTRYCRVKECGAEIPKARLEVSPGAQTCCRECSAADQREQQRLCQQRKRRREGAVSRNG